MAALMPNPTVFAAPKTRADCASAGTPPPVEAAAAAESKGLVESARDAIAASDRSGITAVSYSCHGRVGTADWGP